MNFKKLQSIFKKTTSLYRPVWRSGWIPILTCAIFLLAMKQTSLAILKMQDTGERTSFDPSQLVVALFDICRGLIFVLIIPVLAHAQATGKAKPPLWKMLNKWATPLTIESLRALGRTALYLLLFVIPGILKFIRLYFVPFIVMFHPRYDKGEIDALDYSETLVKGHTLFLVFILVLTSLMQTFVSSLTQAFSLFQQPVLFLLFSATEIAVDVFVYILVYQTFVTYVQSKEQEPAI